MNPRKKVTIRDLARELGMSDRSVSQALNPRESNVKLNPATVERIQALAVERGYRVDASARAMRYGRFFNIGYFEASHFAIHYPLLGAEAGIFDAASARNYHVVLVKLPSDLSPQKNTLPFVFQQSHLDALVVSHLGNLPPAYVQAIEASQLPVVYLNEKRPANAVYVDDVQGSAELTRFLIAQGHRRISFLQTDPAPRHYSFFDRQAGYEQTLRENGLTPSIYPFPSPGTWTGQAPEIDVIMCPDDLTALRLQRVFYQSNIRIPDQVGITGYNDDFAEESPVHLTSMKIPFYDMARAAVDMVIDLLEDKERKPLSSKVFAPRLIVRSSTRPAPLPVG